jgi:hypothetical protein
MLAYQLLPKRGRGSQLSVTGVDMKARTSCPVNVEKILKKFKTHVCAMGEFFGEQNLDEK